MVATWSDSGSVNVWNVDAALQSVENQEAASKFSREEGRMSPLFSFTGHQSEGFALDWSPTVEGSSKF